MRRAVLFAILVLPLALGAQTSVAATASRPAATHALSRADSILVRRVLLAEDRRDASDNALTEAAQNADPRIRALAWRAKARITDPQFVARDSLPTLPSPPVWPEPAWLLRYRTLAAGHPDCGALRTALADSVWAVRLEGADLITDTCAGSADMPRTLRAWVDALPADASHRAGGGGAWQAAAHALVALARVWPSDARPRIDKAAGHRQWQVRMYAARAAAILADSSTLRRLAADTNDNVRATAITALGKLTAHADDDTFLIALQATGAPVVRAAALALHGSPRADVRAAADAAFARWVARENASAHDVRTALLATAGRRATDDRPPSAHAELSPRTVALALGAAIRLRVTMAQASGRGSFVVQLRGDVAPIMAARVLALARSGYYNGLTWHRVEPDFVIQGGSPGANEYVGLPQAIRDELGAVPQLRGTIGMSTRGHDTGDAQWFINLRDNLRLGRDYTVFAEVVKGMDVVDGILEGDTIQSMSEVPVPR